MCGICLLRVVYVLRVRCVAVVGVILCVVMCRSVVLICVRFHQWQISCKPHRVYPQKTAKIFSTEIENESGEQSMRQESVEVDEELVRSVRRRGRGGLRRGISQIWKWTVGVVLKGKGTQRL